MNIIPYNENEVRDKYKASGNKRTIIIAKVDGVPENYINLKVILDEMKLHKIPKNISLSCDLKVVNIILGISSCTSMHGCPYCEGYKVDDRTGKKTNKKGRYRIGRLRTENNIIENKIL